MSQTEECLEQLMERANQKCCEGLKAAPGEAEADQTSEGAGDEERPPDHFAV